MSSFRRLSVGLRLFLLGMLGASVGLHVAVFAPTSSARSAMLPQDARGFELYAQHCSSCHGIDASGTGDGPSLLGVGPAAVDFMLSTGRMPLANPGDQAVRQEPALSDEEIAAIVGYVSSLAQGEGEPIPTVEPSRGSLADGQLLFAQNCAACHGIAAQGNAVGGGGIAPSLGDATPRQIGEAIRTGPGVMPRFGDIVLDDRAVDSIARYVARVQHDPVSPGGANLGFVGAVAEGFIVWLVGIGLVLLLVRGTGSRA
jgi:quinol---cytochrome-c reductase cytochrome c subunit